MPSGLAPSFVSLACLRVTGVAGENSHSMRNLAFSRKQTPTASGSSPRDRFGALPEDAFASQSGNANPESFSIRQHGLRSSPCQCLALSGTCASFSRRNPGMVLLFVRVGTRVFPSNLNQAGEQRVRRGPARPRSVRFLRALRPGIAGTATLCMPSMIKFIGLRSLHLRCNVSGRVSAGGV